MATALFDFAVDLVGGLHCMDLDLRLEAAAEALREAEALLITAGAGMGVDSGLPDFRGNEGFWRAYPPIRRLGLSFVEMANPGWFTEDPPLAWGFYGHRLNLYRQTLPHAGFQLLLEMARSKPAGYFVFTSNVDGHFQKSTFDSDRIEECHGSIHFLQCSRPCHPSIWSAEELRLEIGPETFRALGPLPECPRCGAFARPNILMFGDWSWLPQRTEEQGRRRQSWLETLRSRQIRTAVVELGAGTSVSTVRHFSETSSRLLDGTLIRVNPREPDLGTADGIGLPLSALEGLRRLCS